MRVFSLTSIKGFLGNLLDPSRTGMNTADFGI
jgi:hypothetical protein